MDKAISNKFTQALQLNYGYAVWIQGFEILF